MSVRHWLSSIVVIVALHGTGVMAEELPTEPVLGRGELIGALDIKIIDDMLYFVGELLASDIEFQLIGNTQVAVVETESDIDLASALEVRGLPQLGQPVLLASLLSDELETVSLVVTNDPQEIHRQLQKASELLKAAGLHDEATAIRVIQHEFHSKHLERLTLARKRGELARLQEEIKELAARVDGDKSDATRGRVQSTHEINGIRTVAIPQGAGTIVTVSTKVAKKSKVNQANHEEK